MSMSLSIGCYTLLHCMRASGLGYVAIVEMRALPTAQLLLLVQEARLTHPVDWSKSGIKKTGQEQNERIQGRVRYVSCVVTVRSCRVRGARGPAADRMSMRGCGSCGFGVAVFCRGVSARGRADARWNGAARGIAGKAVYGKRNATANSRATRQQQHPPTAAARQHRDRGPPPRATARRRTGLRRRRG